MSNELINTKWGYIVPESAPNYNPFYDGKWAVVNTDSNSDHVHLSQCETKREGGDGFKPQAYFSTKKNIIIPYSQFQNDFKRIREQNIIAEDKNCATPHVAGNAAKRPPRQRTMRVMTNKDIIKELKDRKSAWTDNEIDEYLKSKGIGPICNKDYEIHKRKPGNESGRLTAKDAVNGIMTAVEEIFGRDVMKELFEAVGDFCRWRGEPDSPSACSAMCRSMRERRKRVIDKMLDSVGVKECKPRMDKCLECDKPDCKKGDEEVATAQVYPPLRRPNREQKSKWYYMHEDC